MATHCLMCCAAAFLLVTSACYNAKAPPDDETKNPPSDQLCTKSNGAVVPLDAPGYFDNAMLVATKSEQAAIGEELWLLIQDRKSTPNIYNVSSPLQNYESSELWSYSINNQHWSLQTSPPTPTGSFLFPFPAEDSVAVINAADPQTISVFNRGTRTWQNQTTTGSPPSNQQANLVFDTTNQRVIMIGAGEQGQPDELDVYSLSLSTLGWAVEPALELPPTAAAFDLRGRKAAMNKNGNIVIADVAVCAEADCSRGLFYSAASSQESKWNISSEPIGTTPFAYGEHFASFIDGRLYAVESLLSNTEIGTSYSDESERPDQILGTVIGDAIWAQETNSHTSRLWTAQIQTTLALTKKMEAFAPSFEIPSFAAFASTDKTWYLTQADRVAALQECNWSKAYDIELEPPTRKTHAFTYDDTAKSAVILTSGLPGAKLSFLSTQTDFQFDMLPITAMYVPSAGQVWVEMHNGTGYYWFACTPAGCTGITPGGPTTFGDIHTLVHDGAENRTLLFVRKPTTDTDVYRLDAQNFVKIASDLPGVAKVFYSEVNRQVMGVANTFDDNPYLDLLPFGETTFGTAVRWNLWENAQPSLGFGVSSAAGEGDVFWGHAPGVGPVFLRSPIP